MSHDFRIWRWWNKTEFMHVSGWFGLNLVGLCGVLAMYETTRTDLPLWAKIAVTVALGCFAVALLGMVWGPRSTQQKERMLSERLAVMSMRLEQAAWNHAITSDQAKSSALVSLALKYAATAIPGPDFNAFSAVVKGRQNEDFNFTHDEAESRARGVRRMAHFQTIAVAMMDLARKVSDGAVWVREPVPELPARLPDEKEDA